MVDFMFSAPFFYTLVYRFAFFLQYNLDHPKKNLVDRLLHSLLAKLKNYESDQDRWSKSRLDGASHFILLNRHLMIDFMYLLNETVI